MAQVNALDRYSTIGLSEADAAAVTEIESLGWFVALAAPGNPKNGTPSVYSAERVGSIPVVRCQSHTLTGLHRAVLSDLARRGESPVTILDGPAVASTSNGRAS